MKHRDIMNDFFKNKLDASSLQTYEDIHIYTDIFSSIIYNNVTEAFDYFYNDDLINHGYSASIHVDNLEGFMYVENRDPFKTRVFNHVYVIFLDGTGIKILDYLVKKGYTLEDKFLEIPFSRGHYNLFKYFIDKGLNIESIPCDHFKVYHASNTIHRNYVILKYLMENGSKIADFKNKILLAVCEGKIFPGQEYEVAKLMLEHGADPNYSRHHDYSTYGNYDSTQLITTLKAAAKTFNVKVVELLFEYNVNHPNEIMLKDAIRAGNERIVEAFLHYGVEYLYPYDMPPLTAHYHAISRGQLSMLKLLVNYSECKELLVNECLPIGCSHNYKDIVLYLLGEGADVYYSNALKIETTEEIRELLQIFA